MAGETPDIRAKARRLKDLALMRAIKIFEKPEDYDKEVVENTFQTVLKSAIPRVQIINGDDDGGAVEVNATITGMQIINQAIGNSPKIEQPEAGTSV